MPILEVKNVTKHFGKKLIINDVSFEVNPGEVVGFLGPNGAGKTTVIKMILGLLSIEKGEITINGQNVKTKREEALQKVGGIIESPELYGYLTGMVNLKLFASMYNGIGNQEIMDAVKLVKLENRINDKVKKYSLGMRQRLGVAQAILHNPNLLILDEPTNGLDPSGIKELRENLRSIAKQGAGVLVSSHQLSEMQLMCDRVVIIENGVVNTTMKLKDIARNTGSSLLNYELEVDNTEKAASLINEKGIEVEEADGILKLSVGKEAAAKIVKLLVEGGINIYSVQYEQKSLEDAFLEVTNAETIR